MAQSDPSAQSTLTLANDEIPEAPTFVSVLDTLGGNAGDVTAIVNVPTNSIVPAPLVHPVLEITLFWSTSALPATSAELYAADRRVIPMSVAAVPPLAATVTFLLTGLVPGVVQYFRAVAAN